MKMLKNTVFDVYKYMNSGDWNVIKYCNTTLFQSFTHLGHDFEVRITKDGSKCIITHRGIYLAGITGTCELKKKYSESIEWYLGLNWDLYPECLSEIGEKLKFITEN